MSNRSEVGAALGVFFALIMAGTLGCSSTSSGTSAEVANAEAQEQLVRKISQGYGGEITSTTILAYVKGVSDQLCKSSGDAPYDINLLNSESVNHFSITGRSIFMTRGLLMRLDNEAQLVSVLELEMAHTRLGHLERRVAENRNQHLMAKLGEAAQSLYKQRTVDLDDLTKAFKVSENGTYGGQYTSVEELEAIKEALKQTAKAGYDPNQFYLYMDTMIKEAGRGDQAVKGGVSFTHNFDTKLAVNVKSVLDQEYPMDPKWKVGSEPYQTNVLDPLKSYVAPPMPSQPYNPQPQQPPRRDPYYRNPQPQEYPSNSAR